VPTAGLRGTIHEEAPFSRTSSFKNDIGGAGGGRIRLEIRAATANSLIKRFKRHNQSRHPAPLRKRRPTQPAGSCAAHRRAGGEIAPVRKAAPAQVICSAWLWFAGYLHPGQL